MNKRLKVIVCIIIILILLELLFNITIYATNNSKDVNIKYSSHVQDIGWMNFENEGEISGTTGKCLRMEAININNLNPDLKIKYQVHVENIGWMDWVEEGQIAGTTGECLRIEAIKIKLENNAQTDIYKIKYRVHVQDIGWMDWAEEGQIAGTTGRCLRMEAIQIKIIKNDEEDFTEENRYYNGIDVSYYQGNIDWEKVKNDNIDFAILRAGFRGYGSSGSLNKDKMFDTYAKNAIENGIDIGVYFFSQATNVQEAIEEANYTLNIIKNYDITYPVIIDVEYANEQHSGRADNVSKEMRTQIVIAFCQIIEQAGYKPMFYADKWFATSNLDLNKLADYEYWLAHYTGATRDSPFLKKSDYSGKYSIWQYSSKGNISGISGNVDLNISNKIF